MKNNWDELDTSEVTRPSFLTWLCILTFIGSGWAIIGSVWSYSMAGKNFLILTEQREAKTDSTSSDSTLRNNRENGFLAGKIKASFEKMLTKENIQKQSIGKFLASLFTLAGAILMWNLKRTGFYLYIVGVIIGIIVPFYLFGNDLIALGASSFSAFFGLVFIALYALNLKSMAREKIKTE